MVGIKNMKMPNCCHWNCPLCNEDGGECMLDSHDTKTDTYKERAKDCPLVEIVTCKDCKHWYDTGNKISTCMLHARLCERDFYCANAERRENGD